MIKRNPNHQVSKEAKKNNYNKKENNVHMAIYGDGKHNENMEYDKHVYTVTWTLTVEAESPQKAVEQCWNTLQKYNNDWTWGVKDEDSKQEWEVDMEPQEPGITEI